MVNQGQENNSYPFKQYAEYITRGEELAYELRIGEVMTRDVRSLSPTDKMCDVLENFRQNRISGAPVQQDGSLCGVISLEDLIRCLLASDLNAEVSKYMTANPITVFEDDKVKDGLKFFVSTGIGRLIVINRDQKLVGILTKGDITRGFLRALQKDYEEEELIRYRASHLFEDLVSDRSSMILRYNIKQGDFIHGGAASSNIKRALLRLGASPQITRRCAIAVYEAEMNLIIHTTNGGYLRVEIEPHRISIRVEDDGPGIENIEQALQPGFSTATEKVRELGFGAGMGLINISRCVDWMKLDSTPGKGTRLQMRIFLDKEHMVGEHHQTVDPPA
jgi:CBS domain-containing protein/anti-sigma regulatory factor (Ser/Thr protein kinase)